MEDNQAAANVGEDGPADFQEVEVVPTEGAVTAEVLHVEQQGELGVAAAQVGGGAGGDVPQRLVAGEAGEGGAGCALADDGEGVWERVRKAVVEIVAEDFGGVDAGRVDDEHGGGGGCALKAGYDDALGPREGAANEVCEAA